MNGADDQGAGESATASTAGAEDAGVQPMAAAPVPAAPAMAAPAPPAAQVDEGASGAGSWAIRGFDYQVDVSVWLALDLMVASRLTAEMTLEAVSEEDIETDLEEVEPNTVADTVPMHGYRLIVQAKRRTGDAWTEAGFKALLTHGKRRASAAKRLEDDPTARYLLVTSAALNGPVRKIGVRTAGRWPAADAVSATIAGAGTDIAGRVAVIGSQDDERLVTDIKTLLLERFRVPRAHWEACLTALRAQAWGRMRSEAGGVWRREEVERVIADHEGYLVGDGERDAFVEPTNWGDLTRALETNHAIMIIGQSGSGKTAASEALWLERKVAIPDLKRVHITLGPDELRADTTQPPVLYDIEDPWGRFRFEPNSRPWNDKLEPEFIGARHDRLFVATSRIDVAEASGAIDSIQRWRMPLDAENYGRAERQRLYRNLSAGLPADLKAFAHEHEASVVRQLGLPLELRKFFDALPGLDRDDIEKNPAAALAGAIERAHKSSIERTVAEQIEAREDVRAATILWALIRPHGRLSADVLRTIDDPLVDGEAALEGKIVPFVNAFVAARNLRQGPDGSLGYYHGKVEAGIETVLKRHPQVVRRTLRLLIDVLIARDAEAGGTWGVETAAEIVQFADRIPGGEPSVNRPSQDRLDAWVETALASEGRDLEKALRLAAAVGSVRSDLAEMARWLEYRPDQTFPGMMDWGDPERDAAWIARMGANPAVRALAERFIRTLLPNDSTGFTDDFAQAIGAVVGDVTPAFLDAARTSAHYGYFRNDDVIAAGAITDLAGFETVVDEAVAALQPSQADLDRAAEINLLIINEEVSGDYAEHLADNDDGETAKTYLGAYVTATRAAHGFAPLAGHRHVETVRRFWLQALLREPAHAPTMDEVEAAFASSDGGKDEADLWPVLGRHWDRRFEDRLIARLVAGHANPEVRAAALDCAVDHVAGRFPDVVAKLIDANAIEPLARLASDLGHRACAYGVAGTARRPVYDALIAGLPQPYRAVALAEIAILEDGPPVVTPEAAVMLQAIEAPEADMRALRVRLASHGDLDATEDLRWVLAESDDDDAALAAIDLAARDGLTDDLEQALDHHFAHVAARALTALADPMPAPLPPLILSRASRSASPVRKALLVQLAAKPHAAHLPALQQLMGDQWTYEAQRGNDDGDFPIARDAAAAIAALEAVPDALLAEMTQLARTTEDLALMGALLACAVRHGDTARQAEVAEMARKGNRIAVGRKAAHALFAEFDRLHDETVALITRSMVLTLPASIAGYHTVTLGLRGDGALIDQVADALAASDDRKVFLALLGVGLHERDPDRAAAVADRLPANHPARAFVLGETVEIERTALIDLGDASAVKEAWSWMS